MMIWAKNGLGLKQFSLRFSAYLCVLCVNRCFQRRGRRGTQRASANAHWVVVLLACYLLFAPITVGAVRAVWAVNDGEKVERDDLNNSNKRANSAWDGHKVKLFGARNEIIAFQLIIEADQDGIKRLAVALPQLVRKGGKSR